MKQILMILGLTLFISTAFSNEPVNTEKKEIKETGFNLSKMDAQVVDGKIYFKVVMSTESENSLYSLVRHNADGSVTSVGIKEGFSNPNNISLLYCFQDELPTEDVEYSLYRIASDSRKIVHWDFSNETIELAATKVQSITDTHHSSLSAVAE